MKNRALVSTAVAALLLGGCAYAESATGGHAVQRVHRTLPAAGVQTVAVTNVSGAITVTAASGSAVTIDAVKRGSGQDALARTHVDVSRDGDSINIETKYDQSGWFSNHNGASVEYTIRVPARMNVEIANVSGPITLSGVAGDVKASEVSGDVRASLGRVDGSRSVGFSAVSGSINVQIAKDSNVRVKGKTITGAIHSFFPANTHKGFVGEDLDGRVGSGSASMKMATVSGGINVTAQ